MKRTPLGQLKPGDLVYQKRGTRYEKLGIIASTVKRPATRSVYVRIVDEDGELATHFTQNWAASLYVKEEEAATS